MSFVCSWGSQEWKKLEEREKQMEKKRRKYKKKRGEKGKRGENPVCKSNQILSVAKNGSLTVKQAEDWH